MLARMWFNRLCNAIFWATSVVHAVSARTTNHLLHRYFNGCALLNEYAKGTALLLRAGFHVAQAVMVTSHGTVYPAKALSVIMYTQVDSPVCRNA